MRVFMPYFEGVVSLRGCVAVSVVAASQRASDAVCLTGRRIVDDAIFHDFSVQIWQLYIRIWQYLPKNAVEILLLSMRRYVNCSP